MPTRRPRRPPVLAPPNPPLRRAPPDSVVRTPSSSHPHRPRVCAQRLESTVAASSSTSTPRSSSSRARAAEVCAEALELKTEVLAGCRRAPLRTCCGAQSVSAYGAGNGWAAARGVGGGSGKSWTMDGGGPEETQRMIPTYTMEGQSLEIPQYKSQSRTRRDAASRRTRTRSTTAQRRTAPHRTAVSDVRTPALTGPAQAQAARRRAPHVRGGTEARGPGAERAPEGDAAQRIHRRLEGACVSASASSLYLHARFHDAADDERALIALALGVRCASAERSLPAHPQSARALTDSPQRINRNPSLRALGDVVAALARMSRCPVGRKLSTRRCGAASSSSSSPSLLFTPAESFRGASSRRIRMYLLRNSLKTLMVLNLFPLSRGAPAVVEISVRTAHLCASKHDDRDSEDAGATREILVDRGKDEDEA
ncbi:hypothetical protein FB451DRAFT_1568445 [Mycena latifolia]|nr:hypothetical protein FB451DRAFT_1568445 [Mycena latifolia]